MRILKVKNWENYNKRKDLKSMKWFALDVDIFQEPKFCEFTFMQKSIFIFVLCYVGKFGRDGETILRLRDMAKKAEINEKDIEETIKLLECEGVIEINNYYSGGKQGEKIKNLDEGNAQSVQGVEIIDTNGSVRIPNESERKRALHNITIHNITEHTQHTQQNKNVRDEKIFTPDEILDLYNLEISNLEGAVTESGMTGKAKVRLLRGDDINPPLIQDLKTRQDWINYFDAVKRSNILHGSCECRWKGFKLRLDWLINRDNWLNVMSGSYEEKNASSTISEAQMKCIQLGF